VDPYSLWLRIIEIRNHQSIHPPRFWGIWQHKANEWWFILASYPYGFQSTIIPSYGIICDMPSFLEKWQKPPFNPAKILYIPILAGPSFSHCFQFHISTLHSRTFYNFILVYKLQRTEFLKANDYCCGFMN
jgi:hypothetical protein